MHSMRTTLSACIAACILIFGVHSVVADPNPNGQTVTPAEMLKIVQEKQKNYKQFFGIMQNQVTRMTVNHELPPFMGGVVNPMDIVTNSQLRTMTQGLVYPHIASFLAASFGVPIGNNSCHGVTPIPKYWCYKCEISVPFVGCIQMALLPGVVYGFPTMITEVAHNTYQSSMTPKFLQDISKNIRFGAADIALTKIPVVNVSLTDVSLKHQCVQAMLAFSAQTALGGGKGLKLDPLKSIMNCVTMMKTSTKVINAARDPKLKDVRGAFGTDPKQGSQEYGYTQVPFVLPRYLYKFFEKMRRPSIKIHVGIAGGIRAEPITLPIVRHLNKPPYELIPDFTVPRAAGSPDIASLAMNEDDPIVGDGRVMLAQSTGLGGKISDLSPLGFLGIGATPKLLAQSMQQIKRGKGWNFFLDSYASHVGIPLRPFTPRMGGLMQSLFSFMPFFEPRLASGLPGTMTFWKQPFICEAPLIAQKFGKFDYNGAQTQKMLTYIKLLLQLLGPKYVDEFNKAYTSMKIPPCMKHFLGPGVPITTNTNTNKAIGPAVKAMKDVLHVPAITEEYQKISRFGGVVKRSPNFYAMKYEPSANNKLKDGVLPTPMSILGRGGDFNFEAPTVCAHPEREEEFYKDLSTHFPLDEPAQFVDYTRFGSCTEGKPAGKNTKLFGIPVFQIINIVAGALGLPIEVRDWIPRTE